MHRLLNIDIMQKYTKVVKLHSDANMEDRDSFRCKIKYDHFQMSSSIKTIFYYPLQKTLESHLILFGILLNHMSFIICTDVGMKFKDNSVYTAKKRLCKLYN